MDLARFWKHTPLCKQALVFTLTAYLALGVPFYNAWATTYYVDSSRPNDFGDGLSWATAEKTIGAGLADAAATGDVVRVAPGTYDTVNGETFPLLPGDGVTLRSDDGTGSLDAANTIITGTLSLNGLIRFDANLTDPTNTRVEGFTIANADTFGRAVFIVANGTENISPTISNNTITGNLSAGILISANNSAAVSPLIGANTVSNSSFANARAVIFRLNNNAIAAPMINANTFSGPIKGGVFIDMNDAAAFSGTISNNSITGATGRGIEVYFSYGGSGTIGGTIDQNQIVGNGLTGIGMTIYGGGLVSVTSTISNNTITGNNGYGIYISHSNSSGSNFAPTITNNTITGNTAGSGIYIYNKSSGTISGTISGNTISGNSVEGIFIRARDSLTVVDSVIEKNIISGNGARGIFLNNRGTASPKISRNTITGNQQHGVHVFDNTAVTTLPDLGGGAGGSVGLNTIKDNADSGLDGTPYDNAGNFDLYNDANRTIFAQNNWWGATPPNVDSGTTVHITNQDVGITDQVNITPSKAQSLGLTLTTGSTGDVAGGTTVTLTADSDSTFVDNVGASYYITGFTDGVSNKVLSTTDRISVQIGGVAATSVIVAANGASLTATAPASTSAGAKDIIVTNPAGQTGTLTGAFTYTEVAAGPGVPTLIFPADGATGLATTIEFRWQRSTDSTVTYQFYICENATFTGCSPQAVASASNGEGLLNGGQWAGGLAGLGSGLFMFGFVAPFGFRNRKWIILMLAALAVLLSASCDSSSSGAPASSTEVTHTVSGLTSGATYFWKVAATNANGTNESANWSFTCL